MIKCQYQGCDKKATCILPASIGPKNKHMNFHLCEDHYHFAMAPKSFSYEVVVEKGKIMEEDR